jgi:hypothetical protein
LIQLADGLQASFEVVILFDRLTNLWDLIGTQTHLSVLPAWITDRQYPERMAFTTSAFQASRGVMDGSLKQRATEDLVGGGELGCEFIAFANGLLSCHQ